MRNSAEHGTPPSMLGGRGWGWQGQDMGRGLGGPEMVRGGGGLCNNVDRRKGIEGQGLSQEEKS